MLDDLLGRSQLKDRIETLEAENEHLQARNEAEEERRAAAVRDRQEADVQINRLEDRIAELEDRVERSESTTASLDVRATRYLRGERLEAVLHRLDSLDTGPEGALTAMVEGDCPEPVSDAFGERSPLVRTESPCLAITDDAGLLAATLTPPILPEPFETWSDGFELESAWFRPTGTHAIALVRSDLFALGEFRGAEQREAEGFQSDVKSDHSKGGFSQSRFERRRDAQIEAHLAACRDAIEACDTEQIYVVGEQSVLGAVEELADVTATVDATGSPDDALEDAVNEFWTTKLRLL